jgi:NADH:ubiquinone oxidoreductase subunit D
MTEDRDRSVIPTLSESLGFAETIIEVGHTHPGVRRVLSTVGGTISFLAKLDDQRIVDLEVEIGIGHRGFEKEVENGPWHRALPYVNRLGYASGVMAEIGYCIAVEKLAGMEIPERATWLRMMVSEVARIEDHFARLSAVAVAIGLSVAERTAHQGELRAARFLKCMTARGPLGGWARLGGVASAPTSELEEAWSLAKTEIETIVARFDKVAVGNPSCQKRLREVAVLSADDCIAWGVTGPILRSAGMPMDVRRDSPYLDYAAVDFDIPIGENGDAFDRMLVVVEEIRQSLRIIDQAQSHLAGLDGGAIRCDAPGWCEPDIVIDEARQGVGQEGPIIAAGEAAFSIESSTGELGFFLVSDGGALPRRIRCRAASFQHAQAMPQMLRGGRLDDLLPTAAMLHLVSAECDR